MGAGTPFRFSRTQRIRSDYSIPKASLRSAKATTAKLVSQDISQYRCIGAETLILEYASRLAVFVALKGEDDAVVATIIPPPFMFV
jgi:hypothetical protein